MVPVGRRLLIASSLILCVAAAAAGASARSRVLLGVLGDPGRFEQQTGQVSATRLRIVGWGQGATFGSPFAALLGSMGSEPMLGLSTTLRSGGEITPRQIALGQGDGYLVALNHAIHAFGKPMFLRPYAEMNGHWNPYSAYDENGTARDSSHTPALFRAAFARTSLLAHGGPEVASALARLGQPPVHGSLETNSNVRVIWNPQGRGSPDLPGNAAAAYYPGDSYVDVVGDDLYDIGFHADWSDAEALYDAHPGKPFAFPEWAPWAVDDPGFVAKMAAFVKAHPRTLLVSYYSGAPGSVFDLATKPRSRAAYRQLIVPLGR